MTVRVLFFGALAEQLQCRELTLTLPATVTRIGDLRAHLIAAHTPAWQALGNDSLRCARNQTLARMTQAVTAGDEIAFFPPVTGG